MPNYIFTDYATPSQGYQYAILKDGKLFLPNIQTENNTEQQREIQSQLMVLQESIEAPNTEDISKITGRNLITGQTVTLDGYISKIKNRNLSHLDLQTRNYPESRQSPKPAHSKLAVYKTASGKKIIGRILKIIKPNENGNNGVVSLNIFVILVHI